MKFLFYHHSDPNAASMHVDEELPKNELDTLPDMSDGDRERAEKQQLAEHTRGGVLITRERASEEWVNKLYREVLAIPGIAAIGILNAYEMVIHKGQLFSWKQLEARLPLVITETLGATLATVESKPCPQCHEGGHGGGGGMAKVMRMVMGGPGGMPKIMEVGSSDDEEEESGNKGEAVEQMLQRVLQRAEQLGAFVCCVVDHPDVGHLCAERLPPKAKRKGLASAVTSDAYDKWSKTPDSGAAAKPAAAEEQGQSESDKSAG